MRVAFDFELLGDAHGTWSADASDIIATEVEQHDVLSDLLFVGEQFGGKRFIFLGSRSARSRSGDRVDGNLTIYRLDEQFGRGTDNLETVEIQVEHVRRGIDGSERTVEVERLDRGAAG